MRHRPTLLIALAGFAAPALAGGGAPQATLQIGSPSSASLTADTFTFVGSASDSDTTTGVTGEIVLASTDFNNPVDLQLIDLSITLDPAAVTSSFIDGGPFFGTAGPMTLTLDAITLDAGGKPKKLESGIASFSIPVRLSGEANATYDLIGIDPANGVSVDLATLDPSGAFLDIFFLASTGGELVMEGVLLLDAVTIPFEPALVEISLSSATSVDLNATGDDPNFQPEDFCSRADIAEPCGVLDLGDIVAFVQGFSAQDPISDINGDSIFDLADVVGFVTAFQNDVCDPNGAYYCYGYGYGGYAAIEFHEGNAAYAFGDHTALTAGLAGLGAALMLGFGSFRRKHA